MPAHCNDINILIAYDKEIYRKGLVYAFSRAGHYHVSGEASTLQELVAMANHLKPDIVITSYAMQQVNCVESLCVLVQQLPDVSFIVCDDFTDGYQLAILRQAGIRGILQDKTDLPAVIACVQQVYNGETFFDAATSALMHAAALKLKAAGKGKIKARFNASEKLVMELICAENTVEEIAAKTFRSPDAIKSIKKKLQQKTLSKGVCGIVKFAVINKFLKSVEICLLIEWLIIYDLMI